MARYRVERGRVAVRAGTYVEMDEAEAKRFGSRLTKMMPVKQANKQTKSKNKLVTNPDNSEVESGESNTGGSKGNT